MKSFSNSISCVYLRLFVIVAYVAVVSSCSVNPTVCDALEQAGDNRQELEAVLEHYRVVDRDSRKLEAAEFLISNMPLHYSISPEPYKIYCDSLTHIFSTLSKDSAIVAANNVAAAFDGKLEIVRDIDIITSEYLIDNIDRSFDLWENSPFLQHLDFDEFCEMVLPYKCFEMQPLDDWKEYAKFPAGSDLAVMSKVNDFCILPRSAAEVVSSSFKEEIAGKTSSLDGLRKIYAYDYNLMRALPYGTCQEYSNIDVIAERANGVPVYTDFTPNWPFRQNSHYWSVVRNRCRKDIDYLALERLPGDAHYEDFRLAKVFRRTYSPDHDLLRMLRRGEHLPQVFASYPFIRDVTEEYCHTHNMKVKLLPKYRWSKYAYLAVFDCYMWKIVDYGQIRLGRAIFENVGVDSMYLVMVTDRAGNIVPASRPFVFTYDGSIDYVDPEVNHETGHVTLSRKYPATWHIWNIQKQIRGGAIDAADLPDMSDAREVGAFSDDNIFSEELIINDTVPHRYWRLRSTRQECTYFAEIYFYRNGNRLKPKVHSYTLGLSDFLSGLLIDDEITVCPLIAKDGYVSFDFGCPVSLDKVSIIKRGDLNDITPGEEYALYAWLDNDWKLIDKKVAEDVSITFENAPIGALLYIKCLTSGMQNRIFL